jgi:plasmid maintenance system antidote protein VapI
MRNKKNISPAQKYDDFNIPPVELTEEEQLAIRKALQQLRKEIDARTPEDVKWRNRFLQLKFQMESYLEDETESIKPFGFFLQAYIDRAQKKNKEFANDISINYTELSQVINQKRRPSEKMILRLHIHSNQFFPTSLWFSIVEKERKIELSNNTSLIKEQMAFVKNILKL